MWQAEVRVDLDAIRENVSTAARRHHRRGDGGGQGRRVRPRHAPGRPRGARRRRRDLARRLHPRRGADPAPGRDHRAGAGLAARARAAAARGRRRRRRPGRGQPGAAGRDDRGEPRAAGRPARLHLKIDTGLSRGGATVADWPALLEAAAKAQADGLVEVVGVWSHFVYADAPGHPTIDRQLAVFHEGLAMAERAGLRPRYRHLANSAATLTRPDTHFDLVRPGIAVYGLSPVAGEHVRAAAGDDRPRPGDAHQAGARRHRRLVRAHLHHRARDDPGAGAARLRRRGAPARVQRRPGAARRRSAGRSPGGSAWTSSCSTAATTRWPPATWRRCSAAATTASRPPTTGPRRSARSTTRSSPGSAAPGCPGSTTASDAVTSRPHRRGRGPARRAGSAGIVGAAVGVAAAGLAAGVADRAGPGPPAQGRPGRPVRRRGVRRAAVRRGVPHWSCRTAPTSTSRWSSRPGRCRGDPTVVLVHGFCLDMGTFHFQRKMLAERGDYRIVVVRPARSRPVRPAGDRRVRPRRARPDAARR